MTVTSTTTEEVRARLVRLFPAFDGALVDSHYSDDEGDFTEHGLWAEFSHFYQEQVSDFASPQIADLFDWIETIVASDPDDQEGLANAVCTCFLENISSTSAGEASLSLMGTSSRAIFAKWHFPAVRVSLT